MTGTTILGCSSVIDFLLLECLLEIVTLDIDIFDSSLVSLYPEIVPLLTSFHQSGVSIEITGTTILGCSSIIDFLLPERLLEIVSTDIDIFDSSLVSLYPEIVPLLTSFHQSGVSIEITGTTILGCSSIIDFLLPECLLEIVSTDIDIFDSSLVSLYPEIGPLLTSFHQSGVSIEITGTTILGCSSIIDFLLPERLLEIVSTDIDIFDSSLVSLYPEIGPLLTSFHQSGVSIEITGTTILGCSSVIDFLLPECLLEIVALDIEVELLSCIE